MTLAIVLIVLGVGGFTVYLVTTLMKFFGGMQRIEVPGRLDVTLERSDYTIYWETDSRFNRAPDRSDLDIAVVSKEGDFRPSVSSSGLVTSRYSTMDRVGVSVAGFSAPQKGDYAITVAAAAGKTLPKGGLALGRSMGVLGVLQLVLLCVAMLAAGVGSGVYLLVTNSKAT